MKIMQCATLLSRLASPSWCTGDVWLDEVARYGKVPEVKVTRVTFSPSARTAWHMHPLGQALYILSGTGWVQLKGERAKMLCAGDSVWIEADELHWHGAAKDHILVHLAIQGVDEHDVDVVWMDQLTDKEYTDAGV
jgi:quercetin dioxygenase-like cupin family protein